MNPKLAAAVVVGAVAALSIGVAFTKDPDPKDVKPIADAVDAGLVKEATTFAMQKTDGTTVYASVTKDVQGNDVVTYVDHSPCRRRPKGVPVALCSRVCSTVLGVTEKAPCDPGAENVMQAGQWVDNGGCEEAACVVVLGKERFK